MWDAMSALETLHKSTYIGTWRLAQVAKNQS
jgi:hypothetical protein